MPMGKRRHLIVGCGPAALSALKAIRNTNFEDEVKLVAMERHVPYSPAVVPYLLAGRINEAQLLIRDEDYFKKMKSTLMKGKEVVDIVPEKREVVYRDGGKDKYDRLLLASGSEPSKIPIKGLEEVGFLGFHTLADCRRLLQELREKTEVVIYGAGLVAVEVAIALLERGCSVNLIARSRILRSYFDNEAGSLIEDLLIGKGCQLFKGSTVSEVRKGKEKIEITLSNGVCLESDIFLNALGVQARTSYLGGSGLEIEKGVLVDKRMKTNVDEIYAAGDIAEAPDFFFNQLVLRAILPNAVDQGRIAGSNMAGEEIEYKGSIGYNVCNLFGTVGFSGGMAMPESGDYEIFKEKTIQEGQFKKLVFKEDRIVGAIFLGVSVDPGVFRYLIENQISCEGCKDILFKKPGDVSRWLMLSAEEETNKAFRT